MRICARFRWKKRRRVGSFFSGSMGLWKHFSCVKRIFRIVKSGGSDGVRRCCSGRFARIGAVKRGAGAFERLFLAQWLSTSYLNRLKISRNFFSKYLEVISKMPYLCTRFERKTRSKRRKLVLINFEKSSEIFWRFRKKHYLCTRFDEILETEHLKKGSWKILKKIFKKDLVVQKIILTFAPLSAKK